MLHFFSCPFPTSTYATERATIMLFSEFSCVALEQVEGDLGMIRLCTKKGGINVSDDETAGVRCVR
jgi:hypothetical protein